MDSGSQPKQITSKSSLGKFTRNEISIGKSLEHSVPPVAGLVLAGGKSTRMERDKTIIEYHGIPQRNHLYQLLSKFSDDVYISCRPDQASEMGDEFNCIKDLFLEMGPLGALLSAFRYNPNTAWLAIACDMPLLSSTTFQYLLENRNPTKIATAFKSKGNSGLPEPLITIWEPKSYMVLMDFFGKGYLSPRKVLINSDIELLDAPAPRELMNVNHPEEYREVVDHLAAN